MLGTLAFATAFAALNRARGSKLFDLTTSTTVARIVSTGLMAALVLAVSGNLAAGWAAWWGLYIWSVPEWGKYMGAACGNPVNPEEKGFILSEWAVKKSGARDTRLQGLIGTAVRMALAAPVVIAVARLTGGSVWPSLLTPLMALPYFLLGFVLDSGRAWKYGEYCAGAVIGVLLLLTVS